MRVRAPVGLAKGIAKLNRVQWRLVRHRENREKSSDKRLYGTWMLLLFAFLFCHLEFFNLILCNERKQLNLNNTTVWLQLLRSLHHLICVFCYRLCHRRWWWCEVPATGYVWRRFFFIKFNYKVRSTEKAGGEHQAKPHLWGICGKKECIPFQPNFNSAVMFLFFNLFIHFSLKLGLASGGQTNQKQLYFTQSQAHRWPPLSMCVGYDSLFVIFHWLHAQHPFVRSSVRSLCEWLQNGIFFLCAFCGSSPATLLNRIVMAKVRSRTAVLCVTSMHGSNAKIITTGAEANEKRPKLEDENNAKRPTRSTILFPQKILANDNV